MSTFLLAISTWLHTLATVVFIGYYLFLSLVFLPIFERHAQGKALRELLEEVSGRLRPYFGGSLLIFIVTGTYLMMINEKYLGLGQFLRERVERSDRDQTRARAGFPGPGDLLRASHHGEDQRRAAADVGTIPPGAGRKHLPWHTDPAVDDRRPGRIDDE